MAVAFDAVGPGSIVNSTSGASWSHPIGASATALTVEVTGQAPFVNVTSLTTHTVKVGTTPLTLLGVVNCNNTNGVGWVELWGLINPPTGAQTITVLELVSGIAVYLDCTSVSYTGVTSFGTTVTNFGNSTTLNSGAIVSAPGNMVVSAQGVFAQTLSAGTGTVRYNQPTSANGNDVTLLVQDKAGAATVTQTSTSSGASGFLNWGVVSVNLVAGTQWHLNAAMALTATRSAVANSVGRAWTVGASLAMTTAATAAGTGQHLGPALRYVGRPPDSSSVLSTAAYTNTEEAVTLVTPTYISQQMAIASANLVTESWIDEQVANHSTQDQVTTALGAYTPTSDLGAHNGVAQLNGSRQIPAGQLSAVVTNSLALSYDAVTSGTIWLPPGQAATTASNTIGAVPLAQVTIPNPGYPWIPWPFAVVQAQAGGTPSGIRLAGNNNFGFLAVTPVAASTPIYAAGVCTDDTLPNYYQCLPFGAAIGAGMTPLTQPPIVGGTTLLLSGCSWSGTAYTFWGTGLVFYVLVLPAVGG